LPRAGNSDRDSRTQSPAEGHASETGFPSWFYYHPFPSFETISVEGKSIDVLFHSHASEIERNFLITLPVNIRCCAKDSSFGSDIVQSNHHLLPDIEPENPDHLSFPMLQTPDF
jgi:hypothetical protein